MEPFVGQIQMFGFNFAPRGWAFCHGQLLPIAQNQALFSLLGTTYGGDGRTTFALPDLRGRAPMHFDQGPGLSDRQLGEAGGAENVTLISNQMPAHNHVLHATSAAGSAREPAGHVLAKETAGQTAVYGDGPVDSSLRPESIGAAGGSQPHANMPPYLCINFCIALEGIYPPRP